MNYKIVSDSSSNVLYRTDIAYECVPLKVNAGDKEYVDNTELDLAGMIGDLKKYKGKSGTSCPNVQEWLDAFGDAENVFCITITKHLSGSYNAAMQACKMYTEEYPDRKAYVFDSLTAGPELPMIADKIVELVAAGKDFDTVVSEVLDYHNHLHTLFCLQSLNNLARNGRVNPAVAKIATALGIRMVGDAVGGTIHPVAKPRGEKKAIAFMAEEILSKGLTDGAYVRISHCYNSEAALELKEILQRKLPNCRFVLEPTTALCSFYAELGGIIVGWEGELDTDNLNYEH